MSGTKSLSAVPTCLVEAHFNAVTPRRVLGYSVPRNAPSFFGQLPFADVLHELWHTSLSQGTAYFSSSPMICYLLCMFSSVKHRNKNGVNKHSHVLDNLIEQMGFATLR
jgi:hypothetical protein